MQENPSEVKEKVFAQDLSGLIDFPVRDCDFQ
jgi:hypothetical protein